MGRIAERRARTAAVRALGGDLVQRHQGAQQRLKNVANLLGEALPSTLSATHLRVQSRFRSIGLLLSNAKASFDAFDSRLRALAGSITELDQRLRQYGEETARIRANLCAHLAGAIADTWGDEPHPSGVYPVYPGGRRWRT